MNEIYKANINMILLMNLYLLDCMNTMLMKQDPVMVTANHKDEFQDHDDFILTDALFDNRYAIQSLKLLTLNT